MKTFDDLEFHPHPHAIELERLLKETKDAGFRFNSWLNATQARMDFPNGYGISVLCGPQFYSNGIDRYEVGVMYKGRLFKYFPEDSVRGWQTKEQVTKIMKKVQQIKD